MITLGELLCRNNFSEWEQRLLWTFCGLADSHSTLTKVSITFYASAWHSITAN